MFPLFPSPKRLSPRTLVFNEIFMIENVCAHDTLVFTITSNEGKTKEHTPQIENKFHARASFSSPISAFCALAAAGKFGRARRTAIFQTPIVRT